MELLSPAGSMDALRAAVQNGADAVYLGLSAFNARRGAKNFTLEELQEAVTYCHVRGVQVHLAINILVSDREMLEASECIRHIVGRLENIEYKEGSGVPSFLKRMFSKNN